MSKINTPKNSVCAHLVKLYKSLLRLAPGPIVSEKQFCFPASGPTSWYTFSTDLGFSCPYSGNKEELHQGSAEARFFSWKVLLSRTRRMFLQTVVLPFCIHATIPTNNKWHWTKISTGYLRYTAETEINLCLKTRFLEFTIPQKM